MPPEASCAEFRDRSVIITGGASGIGLETGKLFQRRSANKVILIDRDWSDSTANQEFAGLEAEYGEIECLETRDGRRIRRMVLLQANVGDPAEIERLFSGGRDSIPHHR